MSKTIKLTGKAELEAVAEYVQARKVFDKECVSMQARHKREVEELIAVYRKRFRELFRIATEKHIPDPDEAFNSGSHMLFLQFYEEHGDAFIAQGVENPEVEESSEDLPGPPRKIVIQ